MAASSFIHHMNMSNKHKSIIIRFNNQQLISIKINN